MTDRVIPMHRPLADQLDIPLDVRRQATALASQMTRVESVLSRPSALPAVKAKAKDDLAQIAKAALNLWSIV